MGLRVYTALYVMFGERGLKRSKEIFDIDIASVKTTEKLYSLQSLRMKPTPIVIPDFPQLEAKLINSAQRSPKPEQLV